MSSQKRLGLAPGFCHVDAFDTDDNYERDEQGEVIEEISYVTLDLGAVEPTLVPSSSTYRLMVSPSIPWSLDLSAILKPCRAWIRQPHFFNSQARFSRVPTSHCLALSSSLLRTRVRLVDLRILR